MSRTAPKDLGVGFGVVAQRVAAFLDTIAWSEIQPPLLAASDDGYNVLVGATATHPKLFTSYDRHPRIYNQAMNSTAAGRYQFIYPTWSSVSAKLELPDFSPRSQDLAAVELVRQRHALSAVMTGDISAAIILCSPEWASFSGSTSGQPKHSTAALLAAYAAAFAKVAPDFSDVVAGVESTAPQPGK